MSRSRLETFRALVEKNPENAMGRFSLANEYFNSEMYEEAVKEIERYLELTEDEGAAYRILAESHIELGNIDKAKEAYRRGIKISLGSGHSEMAEEFEDALQFMD